MSCRLDVRPVCQENSRNVITCTPSRSGERCKTMLVKAIRIRTSGKELLDGRDCTGSGRVVEADTRFQLSPYCGLAE